MDSLIPFFPHSVQSEDGLYEVVANETLLWFQLCDGMIFNRDPPRLQCVRYHWACLKHGHEHNWGHFTGATYTRENWEMRLKLNVTSVNDFCLKFFLFLPINS